MIKTIKIASSLAFSLSLAILQMGYLTYAQDQSDYLTVTGPCNLEFPRDHGPHPGYRTEWWYYTGNLKSQAGQDYGFQLTFFRSQISPPGADQKWPRPVSAWRARQIYMAHAAVTDIGAKKHLQAEAVAREAIGMAAAEQAADATVVFLNRWSARITADAHRLNVNADDFSYELTLKPVKPLVLHGQAGYSLKGSDPRRASCYMSFTRLDVEGVISIGSRSSAVEGSAWMDHEFSTAPLEPGLVGWDWFSLQVSDHTEVMVYLLRKDSGRLGAASSGTFVDKSGQSRHLTVDDFKVTVVDTWKSGHSKAVYPVRWRLQIFPLALDLTIVAKLADQEMLTLKSTGLTYWEGCVSLSGQKGGRPVHGQGFVELTGYAKSFDASM